VRCAARVLRPTRCWRKRVFGNYTAVAGPAPLEPVLTLDACYRHCGEIARRHSKSFFLCSRFLPPAKRLAVWAVYAFCRTADDLADGAVAPDARLDALDAWEAQLRGAYAGRANDPIFVAFADAAARYDVPLQAALDLLRGARMDVTVDRYATYDDLRGYCYLVASTVGVMVAPILGTLDDAAVHDAIALGHAMQMTNILRDVGEDARMRRIYLPQDEMARFGYTEADLFAGVVDERFAGLMQFQIDRARQLYRDAEPGIARLEPESRYAVRLALHLYRDILAAIEANRYDVFTRRAFVPLPAKLVTAVALSFRR
jgi:15-cis-phytoene synthase